MRLTGLMTLAVLLAGCQSTPGNAPVSDRQIITTEAGRPAHTTAPARTGTVTGAGQESAAKRSEKDWRPQSYTVKRGDTLYAIALDFGLDYRELAAWNAIADPNRILAGQTLRLTAPAAPPAPVLDPEPAPVAVVAKPLAERLPLDGEKLPAEVAVKSEPKAEKIPYTDEAHARIFGRDHAPAQSARAEEKIAPPPATKAVVPPEKVVAFGADKWNWPARGDLLTAFDGARNKGISIGGKRGDPVLAANAGKVVYVGNAIQAYGHLAIVKHGAEYLTVYAHNAVILVKEGQQVEAGQKIAEMGARPGGVPALHFEVRKLGQPVDPARVLPPR